MWNTVDMILLEWEILGLYSIFYQANKTCGDRFQCFCSDFSTFCKYITLVCFI